MQKDGFDKFEKMDDEELINIIENESDNVPESEINLIEGILQKRGYDIDTIEDEAESINYKPLIIGILFLILNFYLSGTIYNYQMAGTRNLATSYLEDMGIWHDIVLRVFIIMIILYYRSKRKKQNLIIWTIAGLIFGAWALVALGVSELFYSSSNDEDDSLETQ